MRVCVCVFVVQLVVACQSFVYTCVACNYYLINRELAINCIHTYTHKHTHLHILMYILTVIATQIIRLIKMHSRRLGAVMGKQKKRNSALYL